MGCRSSTRSSRIRGRSCGEMSVLEVRKLCHEYAEKYVKIQSEQFQRLGILGDWDNPYLTMSPGYEAETLEVFAKFVEAGLVYKKLKPVPWSMANQTALADAELEYQDVADQQRLCGISDLWAGRGEYSAGLDDDALDAAGESGGGGESEGGICVCAISAERSVAKRGGCFAASGEGVSAARGCESKKFTKRRWERVATGWNIAIRLSIAASEA